MPRPRKTQSEIRLMQDKILDIARQILQTAGPEALTSRAIARKLGIAHMSLFTYFHNQDDILAALRAREMDRWFSSQQPLFQGAKNSEITPVVQEALQHYLDFAHENPNLYRLAWSIPEVREENSLENRQRMLPYIQNMAELLKIGMEQGEFARRDPFIAAGVVVGMINMPHILYHNGKLADADIRDRLAEESLRAAIIYLKHEAN